MIQPVTAFISSPVYCPKKDFISLPPKCYKCELWTALFSPTWKCNLDLNAAICPKVDRNTEIPSCYEPVCTVEIQCGDTGLPGMLSKDRAALRLGLLARQMHMLLWQYLMQLFCLCFCIWASPCKSGFSFPYFTAKNWQAPSEITNTSAWFGGQARNAEYFTCLWKSFNSFSSSQGQKEWIYSS